MHVQKLKPDLQCWHFTQMNHVYSEDDSIRPRVSEPGGSSGERSAAAGQGGHIPVARQQGAACQETTRWARTERVQKKACLDPGLPSRQSLVLVRGVSVLTVLIITVIDAVDVTG